MSLTIIAYHYVRDRQRSRFPALRARTLESFKEQLAHISRTYEVVEAERVIAAARGQDELPKNACWLTFDDGYIDHYANVFPLLHDHRWQGSFFVPAKTIQEGTVFDVNKIHFILAAAGPQRLMHMLQRQIEDERALGAHILRWEDYWNTLSEACYWDTREVLFIKRMLQFALPDAIRTRILDQLFAELVSTDERAFSSELYMSPDQLKLMVRSDMYLGSHGNGHNWLNMLARAEQTREIDQSRRFLSEMGMSDVHWVMCYPHGAFDHTTIDIIKEKGCAVGLTTRSGVADLTRDSAYELPRMDTNDIAPKIAWRMPEPEIKPACQRA